MTLYATTAVVDTKDPARVTDIPRIIEALDADPHAGMPKVERKVVEEDDGEGNKWFVLGRLTICIDVKAPNFYRAGATGLLCVEKALAAAGFNRAELVVELSVLQISGIEFKRPTGLRELGYAA